MGGLKKIEFILVLAFFYLFFFPILYVCRFFDHNTLASWQWVFADVSIIRALLWLTVVLSIAALFAFRQWPERYPLLVIVFLTLSASVPMWGEPELLVDSGRYFLQARYLAEYGPVLFIHEWGRAVFAWTDLPLGPGLYGLLFRLFGETRAVVQFFNTGLLVLTVILTWEIGRILWDGKTGFYAALMLLGMPYLLTQVPLLLVDVQSMFFFTLALYLFLRAVGRGGLWMLAAPPAILAAMLMKYSVWPMLMVLPLAQAGLRKPDLRLRLIRGGAVLSVAAVAAAGMLAVRYDLFTSQFEILLSYQEPALSLWNEGFVATLLFQLHPLVAVLALLGGYRAWRGRDRHFLVGFFFVIFVFAFQVQRIRYLLPLLPLLALMAGRGLRGLKFQEVRQFVAFSLVFSSMLLLFGAYRPFFRTTSMMNLMAAGKFIDSLDGDAVEVEVRPQTWSGGATVVAVPQLDLFTGKRIVCRREWRRHDPPSPYAPLFFTSRLKRPCFYRPMFGDRNLPLVVIAAGPVFPPPSRPLLRAFTVSSGAFRFQTLVTVYR